MPFSSWFGGGATDHQSATKTNGETSYSHHRKVSLGNSSGKKSSIHQSTHSERLRKQAIVAIEPEGDARRIDQGLIDASMEAKDMVHQHQQNVSSSSSWWPSTFSATATTSTPQPSVASQIGGANSINLANSNEVKSNATVKSPGHHRRISSKQTFKLP